GRAGGDRDRPGRRRRHPRPADRRGVRRHRDPRVADLAPRAAVPGAPLRQAALMAGPVIDTDAGRVRGTRSGRLGVWRSIPYAAAPTGDLRFRAPQPVVPWTGVREATEFGAACPQDRRLLRLGPRTVQRAVEDC